MGWHYILNLECRILPQNLDFIQKEYLQNFNESFDIYDEHYEGHNIEENEEHQARLNWQQSKKEIAQNKNSQTYVTLNKFYRDLIDIWCGLCINNFYKYELKENGIFVCEIRKKVNRHHGDLWQDYLTFVKDIIVPISSEITECVISSDDFGDRTQEYTDLELRGGRLELNKLIKHIEHKWEGGDIIETRIVYKRSIKKAQEIDLNRCFH